MTDFYAGGSFFNTMTLEKGGWSINEAGELVNSVGQDGYSGVYRVEDLALTDYSFILPMTGSTLDNNVIGCHFRFTDRSNFYYLAWDRGGLFSDSGRPSLRLYKRLNNQQILLAFKTGIGWDPARIHQVKVTAVGPMITIEIDGEEQIRYEDASAPFLTGAFGPLTYHQRGARFQDTVLDAVVEAFTVTGTFTGTVPLNATDPENPVTVSAQTLEALMRPAAQEWATAHNYPPELILFKNFTVFTTDPDVVLYLDRYTRSNVSVNPGTYVYGHRIARIQLPEAPTGLTATLDENDDVIWRWNDNSTNELGFLVLDEKGNTVATLPPETQMWKETGLTPGKTYYRQVVAYNADGRSPATFLISIYIPVRPPVPLENFTGLAIGARAVLWSWTDPNKVVAGYRLLDEGGNLIADLAPGTAMYLEEELEPETIYTRILVAYNEAGESEPVEAKVYTPIEVPDDVDPPVPVTVFFGAPLSETEIEWTWKTDQQCDGFKLYDEIGTLIAVLPGDAHSYHETDLLAGTTYYRRLTAFNAAGESTFSETAEATTYGFEEEDEAFYTPIARLNYGERLDAFQSGVGDGSDLKVLGPSTKLVRTASSTAERIQWMNRRIHIYPKVDFKFRFQGEGIRLANCDWSRFKGIITSYPQMAYRALVDGVAEEPREFTWEAKLDGQYISAYANEKDRVTWTATAHARYLEGYEAVEISFTWTATAKGQYLADREAGTWEPVTLTTAAQSDQVNSSLHPTENEAKQLTAGTLTEFMASQVESFRTEHGLAEDELVITEYEVAASDSRVTVFTAEADGSDAVWAYTGERGAEIWTAVEITADSLQSEIETGIYRSPESAKALYAGTVADLLRAKIAVFKSEHGIANNLFIVDEYTVTDTSDTAVVFTNAADGSDSVWGYTTLAKNPVWTPVTLSTGANTDAITEECGDADHTRVLAEGRTPAELLADQVTAFKTARGLKEGQFIIDRYYADSHDTAVIVATDPAGTEPVRAYTTAATRFTGSRELSGTVRASDGEVVVWDPAAEPLILVNRLGGVYTGSQITYTLTDLNDATTASVRWADGSTGASAAQPVVAKTTVQASREFDVTARVDEPVIVPSADPDPNWTGILYEITKLSGAGPESAGAYAYFTSNPEWKCEQEGQVVQGTGDLVVAAAGRQVEVSWSAISEWFDGAVNGREPAITDGDGKADFETPILLDLPADLVSGTFTIEVEGPESLAYGWTKSTELITTDPTDTVVFSSDYQDDLVREVPVVLPPEQTTKTVKPNQEIVNYEVQIQGRIQKEIQVYPALPFAFRFKGTGTQQVAYDWSRFAGELAAYPLQTYKAEVKGFAQVPESFKWTAKVNGEYVKEYTAATDSFQWTGKVSGVRIYEVTESMADVFSSWTSFGGGNWRYNAATDEVYTTANSSSYTGFYDPKAVPGGPNEKHDYRVSAIIRVGTELDNDLIGLCFRVKDASNYYYVGWDQGGVFGSAGPALQVRKVVNGKHSLIASADIGRWVDNRSYRLEVEVVGSSITVWIDGVKRIECTDSTFASGAYGPLSYSQELCYFKNLTGIRLEPIEIQADPVSAAVTNENRNPATAKQLTAGTLAEHLAPYVTAYLSANDLTSEQIRLDTYSAVATSPTVTLQAAEDGSEPVTAYTSLDRMPVWEPVELSNPPQTATITDEFGSPEVRMSLGSQTAAQLLADEIAAFCTAHSLALDEFRANQYTVSSDNAKVIVTTSADGSGPIEAYTTAGTYYSASQQLTGTIRCSDGRVILPVSLTLKNRLGQSYAGARATYTLKNTGSSSGVTVTWADGTTENRETLADLAVQSSTKASWTLDEQVEVGAFTEVALPPVDPSWVDVLYAVTKAAEADPEYGPTFAFFMSDPSLRAMDGGDTVYGSGTLMLGTGVRYVLEPWEQVSPWYDGTLNGQEPLIRDGAGKQNYRSGIALTIPPNVIEAEYAVEIQEDPVRPELTTIVYDWESTDQLTTTNPFDIVTFSSDYMSPVLQDAIWAGTKISGGPITVDPGQATLITETLPNPTEEPSYQALPPEQRPTDFYLAITPDNPNVRLVHANAAVTDWTQEGPIEAQLTATVRNPLQGTWNPRIHNGYYYLNNEEFFLYVDDAVQGQLTEHEVVEEVPASISVTMTGERLVPQQVHSFGQAEEPQEGETGFDAGTGSAVDWSEGYLTLVPGAVSGEYVAPEQILDHAAAWQSITVDAEIPSGAAVQLYSRSYGENGWSNWGPHENTPKGTRLAYRLILRSAETELVTEETIPTDLGQVPDSDCTNVVQSGGTLKLTSPALKHGRVFGPVVDLGDLSFIKGMGYLTARIAIPQGTSVTVRTISAASPDGPWNGMGEPQARVILTESGGLLTGAITSAKNRYLRWLIELESTGTLSPEIQSVSITVERATLQRVAPIVRAIRGAGVIETSVEPVIHQTEFRASVPGDQQWHVIGDGTVADLIEAALAEAGIPSRGIGNRQYSVSADNPAIEVRQLSDGRMEARTLDRHVKNVIDRAWATVENGAALITPVPQQGAPLVIYDSRSSVLGPLRQVHFTDADGRPTLDYQYTMSHPGGRYITLPFVDVDPETLTVEIDERNDGNYKTLPLWELNGNLVRLPLKLVKGTNVRITLRLMRSYVVDYNYDLDNGTARVLFHQVEPFEGGRVEVHYETAETTAYLIAKDIELNPLLTTVTSGFLYLTDEVSRTDRVEICANPDTIVANGYEPVTVYIRALDKYGNPVPDRWVRLDSDRLDIGLKLNRTKTDRNGLVTAALTAPPMPEVITLTAEIDGIRASKVITAEAEHVSASLSLEGSATVSSIQPALITGRILGAALRYETGMIVRFSTSAGILVRPGAAGVGASSLEVVTDPAGEAKVELKVKSGDLEDGSIIIVKAEAILADSHQVLQETITVKYEEV